MSTPRGPYLIRWGVYERRYTYPVGYSNSMEYCEGSLSVFYSLPLASSTWYFRVSTIVRNGLVDYAWELNDIPLLHRVKI